MKSCRRPQRVLVPQRAAVLLAAIAVAVSTGLLATAPAQAQNTWPIPAPADRPYLGPIALQVDASNVNQRILRVTQSLPVASGRLTLLHPRWLPGTHGPWGTVNGLTGLQVRAGERNLPWVRDTLDPHAFHVEVPSGVNRVELSFERVTPLDADGPRPTMTDKMLGIQWNQVVLYPAGHHATAIALQPRLKLPAGWSHASALDVRGERDGWVDFAPVSLETLVDSPLFAGAHVKRVELDAAGAAQPVTLHLLADEAKQLEATEAQLDAHRKLVQQADRLFGARQFRRYQFLLAQSKDFGGIGLEHHESSENAVRPGYFDDWPKAVRARELLPHEYVHSWNGKFRRPLDLWTPQFNVPMRNSLLWVYEGLTQYWGRVLAARAGLTTAEQARDKFARNGAFYAQMPGRAWRNLQDTTNDGTIASSRDAIWYDWQRGYDYYDEATLLWLDVDTLIREKSGDQRSLDDFARAFFGTSGPRGPDGTIRPLTYRFEDLVAALNAVQPHDWANFLRERLDHRTGQGSDRLLDGLARGGWKLDFADEESEFARNEGRGDEPPPQRLTYSLGLALGKEGRIVDVTWDGLAFKAGLKPGMQVAAVNLRAYKPEVLAAALSANKDGKQPIELLVKNADEYRIVRFDYQGGPRFPKLSRVEGTPDRLGAILAPR